MVTKQPISLAASERPLSFNLENCLTLQVFRVVRRWDFEVLFPNLKERHARHVGDGLAAGETEGVARDTKDRLLGGVRGDGEGVAG